MCTYHATGTFCSCDCGTGNHHATRDAQGNPRFTCCCHARLVARKHLQAAQRAAKTNMLMRARVSTR